MLKWTVGRRSSHAGGGGRISGSGVASATLGPCLNLRRAAAKLQSRRSDKENDAPTSGKDSPATPASVGKRDSLYMRLDALPAVLRDVSNQITSTTPNSGGVNKPNAHIEYSPSPARAAHSLVTLRRRLTDAFSPPSRTVSPLAENLASLRLVAAAVTSSINHDVTDPKFLSLCGPPPAKLPRPKPVPPPSPPDSPLTPPVEFSLRRRGCIRRRARPIFHDDEDDDDVAMGVSSRKQARRGPPPPPPTGSASSTASSTIFGQQMLPHSRSETLLPAHSPLDLMQCNSHLGLSKLRPSNAEPFTVNLDNSISAASTLPGGSPVGLTLPQGIPSPPSPPSRSTTKKQPQTTSQVKPKTLATKLSSSSSVCRKSSPLALVERRSRSRRCLLFASPSTKSKNIDSTNCLNNNNNNNNYNLEKKLTSNTTMANITLRTNAWKRHRDYFHGKGELDVAVTGNENEISLHVIAGRNLHKASGKSSNAYVKATLIPSRECRAYHRTPVHRDSSTPWFDHRFIIPLTAGDHERRLFISAWHRDKEKRRSEFLGCMSFPVKHVVNKGVTGSFRLLSQSAGHSQFVSLASGATGTGAGGEGGDTAPQALMAARADAAPDQQTPSADRRRLQPKKSSTDHAAAEDTRFLRHLELEPEPPEPGEDPGGRGGPIPGSDAKGGRTPFTTTRRLLRSTATSGGGFGFSVAWTQPPRIERVEPGLPADRAGLRPGDYLVFVELQNVVTLPEDEILHLIRSCDNELTLEVFRRPGASAFSLSASTNGPQMPPPPPPLPPPPAPLHRASTTTCSASTVTASTEPTVRRRLHLPQVTFTSETEATNREDSRRRAVAQLMTREQNYATALHFGVERFLSPLAERRHLLQPHEHQVLFQNLEELLRLSEDILEQIAAYEEPDKAIGRVYLNKVATVCNAYRRYISGLKRADCLLAEKTKNSEFMRMAVEPPVPRRRPDLTILLHQPLEHYRETLKLLQNILHSTRIGDEDHASLAKAVHELQIAYRDATASSGLMEPEGEGRPLLSLQDLESRLVFTRCKPFVLTAPGRRWLFGGDLARVDGRAVRPFWALLFTDLLLLAKVSRDRVLFITEEPLSLFAVTQASFNVRKRATEFRLLMDGDTNGNNSPAAGCGPELTRHPRRNNKKRTVALRAPSPELKAVWQNLLQRQILHLNTTRGGTPVTSPMDSPDQPTATTLSVATLDSTSLRPQGPSEQFMATAQRQLDELIEHRCRQLGKTGGKGGALHLAQWIRGQLGATRIDSTENEEDDDRPVVWSPETLRKRGEQHQTTTKTTGTSTGTSTTHPLQRNESRCEELEVSDTERSQSRSTSDSQVTVRSGGGVERSVSVCRQCHKTCMANKPMANNNSSLEEDSCDGGATASTSWTDPFSPATDVPRIAVLPPTPDSLLPKNLNLRWDVDAELANCTENTFRIQNRRLDELEEVEEDSNDNSLPDEEPPYRTLGGGLIPGGGLCTLKRFGTLQSLEMLAHDGGEGEADGDDLADDDEDDDDIEDEEEEDEWDSENEEQQQQQHQQQSTQTGSGVQPTLVRHAWRGWTARAGSFVAEKMAIFERLGEDSRAAFFLDRYLRPSVEVSVPSGIESPGEDDGSNSAATSGEEVWGTPTSGPEIDEEQAFPASESSGNSEVSPVSDDAELMMDELLAAPLGAPPTGRPGFPPRRRLEPLLEEDDAEIDADDSPPSSSPVCPPQGSVRHGAVADTLICRTNDASCATRHANIAINPTSSTSGGFFSRLRTRRSAASIVAEVFNNNSNNTNNTNHRNTSSTASADNSVEQHRLSASRIVELLSGANSGSSVLGQGGGTRALLRLLGRDPLLDVPTTLPAAIKSSEKQLDRRFWKQLRRRRGLLLNSQSPIGALEA